MTHLKMEDVERLMHEVGWNDKALKLSRVKEDILITDLTGQPRSKHKKLGTALKLRGLRCNHIRNKAGDPVIIIFPMQTSLLGTKSNTQHSKEIKWQS